MSGPRPIGILIGALGGDGGGVLCDWIASAAERHGLLAQVTQIPGVAQRTGATTYYIEIIAPPAARAQPVLALNPAIGEVDVALATELLEAARMISNGFVTPDRTTLIASTHRVFAIAERMSMSDGRFDVGRLLQAANEQARSSLLFDMSRLAEETGGALNAVLLGALAASRATPIPSDCFSQAIRAEGKSVDSNLAAFRAGESAVLGELKQIAASSGKRPATAATAAELVARAQREFTPEISQVVEEGVRRLTAYQDAGYAGLFFGRLVAIRDAERKAGGDGRLTAEVARQLAVRMSFEDIIRVAQAKTAPDRLERVRREVRAADGEPVHVIEHFKPGWEEIASMLPAALGARVLRWSERSGRLNRQYFSMRVGSTTITGFLRLWVLSRLRFLRPRSLRWQQEQAWCESWLDLVARASRIDLELAREIALCATLVKGYSDTLRRGLGNYQRIADEVIEPALAGAVAPRKAIDALVNARVAALADPEGDGLGRTLAAIAASNAGLRRAAE